MAEYMTNQPPEVQSGSLEELTFLWESLVSDEYAGFASPLDSQGNYLPMSL
ncbi:hypothetical protein [Veronia nyctiphanis]|uniref:hypothetical protein n=1 Tax=Veronia nyctiphanis TaxID=1278244 RepID=UPI001375508E|nr:hypothetical protein [Veronia nyctiphanis]